ncbi:MAG: cytochrome c-type biogenesis protein CcmH, partial [Pseudoalteromonas tetraodonis]
MQHSKPVYAFAALLLLSFSASAIDSFKLPEDPEILARYQSLSEEFRCLVCQNQNLADSNAGLAVDLKLE